MAFITLQGTLLDPNGLASAGDELRFTHKSTTGSTLKSAVTLLKLTTRGNYYIDLQYGLVLVEYKDKKNNQFENLGVATVNATNPATTIPELLNALTPVSSAELIEFQSILADCVTAQNAASTSAAAALVSENAAAASAASIDLINDLSQAYIFDTVAEYQASTIAFPIGKTIRLNDTGLRYQVLTGQALSALPNEYTKPSQEPISYISNLQATLTQLADAQQSGVIVFQTYALLDAYTPATTAEETGSFKVANDPTPALNGYYSWVSGTTYIQDASLVNGLIENGEVEAVSGSTVFTYLNSLLLDSAEALTTDSWIVDAIVDFTIYKDNGEDWFLQCLGNNFSGNAYLGIESSGGYILSTEFVTTATPSVYAAWTSALLTGIVEYNLYKGTNLTEAFGSITIDWDKVVDGTRYASVVKASQFDNSKVIVAASQLPNSCYPFKRDDIAVNRNGIINSIIDIELFNSDTTKDYYLQYFGKRYFAGGEFRNYFGIAEVGTDLLVAVANEATTLMYWEDTQTISGIIRHVIRGVNSSGISGTATINWDAIGSGVRYSLPTESAILSKAIQLDRFSTTGLRSGLPFKEFDNILLNSSMKNSIIDIQLTGTDTTKDYYLQYFGKHYNLSGTLTNYFGISEVGGGVVCVAEMATNFVSWSSATVPTGFQRFNLRAEASSGITGSAVVNWDGIPTGDRVFSTDSEAVIDKTLQVLSDGDEPPTDTTHRLLLPDDIYMITGTDLPIYKRSILSSVGSIESARTFINRMDGDVPTSTEFTDTRVSTSEFDSSLRVAMKFNGPDYAAEKYGYYKDINIHQVTAASISGKQATFILTGDSITDFDITSFVGLKLGALGASVSFQGLQSDGGYANEGRSGWEYSNFIGKNTIQFGVGAITPYLSGTSNALNLNPFIRVATAQELIDNPEWCFEDTSGSGGVTVELDYTQSQAVGTYTGDYYTLSIESYIANHSITVGNKLIFESNFGFNDINHKAGSEQSILDALMGVEVLIDRLSKYAINNPTKEIIVGICPFLIVRPFYLVESFSQLIERVVTRTKAVKAAYTSTANLTVDIVPIWASVSRDWGYGYDAANATESALSTDNDSIKSLPVDMGHPRDFGKHEISNVILNYIANKL